MMRAGGGSGGSQVFGDDCTSVGESASALLCRSLQRGGSNLDPSIPELPSAMPMLDPVGLSGGKLKLISPYSPRLITSGRACSSVTGSAKDSWTEVLGSYENISRSFTLIFAVKSYLDVLSAGQFSRVAGLVAHLRVGAAAIRRLSSSQYGGWVGFEWKSYVFGVVLIMSGVSGGTRFSNKIFEASIANAPNCADDSFCLSSMFGTIGGRMCPGYFAEFCGRCFFSRVGSCALRRSFHLFSAFGGLISGDLGMLVLTMIWSGVIVCVVVV